VHVFPGNYEDYVWRKEGRTAPAGPEPPAAAIPSEGHAVKNAPAAAPVKAVVERRLNPLKLKQMKQRRHAIEDEVTRLEVEIADYEQALSHYKNAEETLRVTELLAARRADLQNLMAEWEQVAQAIEANR
jgi:ATP-binding cassette subfamily F protein 3